MTYRHAFHAGNFADCMKHALLVWLLQALQRKPAPISVLDTRAGACAYDLSTGPAERTGECCRSVSVTASPSYRRQVPA
jgi:23S rRNA (adenine2030-N6)-methyltransferase